MECAELDLRNTRVTAQGLLKSQLQWPRIIVGHDQFTPVELVQLGKCLSIAIDEEPSYNPFR